MLFEFNEAGNYETNKTSLLRYRSRVEEMQGRWKDALLHIDETKMREGQAARAQGEQLVDHSIVQKTLQTLHHNELVIKVKELQDEEQRQS